MKRTWFTEDEARREIGASVEALSDFPSVPKGTRGTVVKALRHSEEEWIVQVEWDLPVKTYVFEAMFVDMSLNFLKRNKAVSDQFCKSEYESLVRVFRPVQSQ